MSGSAIVTTDESARTTPTERASSAIGVRTSRMRLVREPVIHGVCDDWLEKTVTASAGRLTSMVPGTRGPMLVLLLIIILLLAVGGGIFISKFLLLLLLVLLLLRGRF